MMRKLKRKTKLNKIKQTDLKFFFFIISFFLFFLSFFYNNLQKFNLHNLIYFFFNLGKTALVRNILQAVFKHCCLKMKRKNFTKWSST